MVETATTTIISRTTTPVPATVPSTPTMTTGTGSSASVATTAAGSAAPGTATSIRRTPSNDEFTRWIFNVKMILCLLLLPLILIAVGLKHLLDYLFSLGQKEKDVFGKVALVTGGGSGLGREICLELARKGSKVAVVDAHSRGCYETVDMISKIPRSIAKVYKTDVSSHREVQMMATKVEKELGPVDILINNASLMPMTSTPHLKSDEIDTILQVNLGSYITITKEFLPKMVIRKSGHVVAIAALSGLISLPGAGIYTATKYGIIGFMEALRAELRLSDCDFIRTTVANAYLMKTSGDLPLLNDAGISESYPGLSTAYVAEKIVRGVLLNHRMVYTPKMFALTIWLLRLLPTKWQDFVLLQLYRFDIRNAHLFYWK